MPSLEFIFGSKVIPFPGERFFIGTGADCHVRMADPSVHARHAEVMREHDGTWWVRDVAGSGSVRVDGHPTWEGQLQAGTHLSVGAIDLSVREAVSGADTVRTHSAGQQRHDPLRTEKETPAIAPASDRGGRQAVLPTDPAVPSVGGQPLDRGAFAPTALAPQRRGGALPLEESEVIENRYRIVRRLATGGMGEVYEAEHVELRKRVAMKVMLPELSRDAEFVARFKREAIASSQIGQHNIVDISDFGRTRDGRFYFVMEFLDGLTLAQHFRRGSFTARRAAKVVVQIARALMAAHDRGIVHRDLKPENVMLLERPGEPDFVKVLDFGVAKVAGAHGGDGLTQVGAIVGTPQYMSPEQAEAQRVDARTDIYSLGLILYEAVAGRPTFQADSPSQLMSMQLTAEPPPLGIGPFQSPVDPQLERLVSSMLKKRPADRPDSMHQVVEQLEQFLKRGASKAQPLEPLPPGPPGSLPLRGGTHQDAVAAPPPGPPRGPPSRVSTTPTPASVAPTLPGDVGTPPSGRSRLPTPTRKIVGIFVLCFVLAIFLGIGAAWVLNTRGASLPGLGR